MQDIFSRIFPRCHHDYWINFIYIYIFIYIYTTEALNLCVCKSQTDLVKNGNTQKTQNSYVIHNFIFIGNSFPSGSTEEATPRIKSKLVCSAVLAVCIHPRVAELHFSLHSLNGVDCGISL